MSTPTVINDEPVIDLIHELVSRTAFGAHRNAHLSDMIVYGIVAGSVPLVESRIKKELGDDAFKHVQRRHEEFKKLLAPPPTLRLF